MTTILEIIEKTAAFFTKKGVPQPRLDAEWLLADTLGCGRMDLYLQFDRPLTEETLAKLRPLVRRRGEREPLAYVLGWAPFRNLRLKVDRRALIPRPETEYLLDLLPTRLQEAPKRCLDLGCGPGTVALALASEYSDAEVTGVDSSVEALDLARENAAQHGLQVNWLCCDWFAGVSGTFDLVVSNPPYLTAEEWNTAEPEVRDHEPKAALIGGQDGMKDLRRIIQQAGDFLNPGGLLALETGIDQHDALQQFAGSGPWSKVESVPDLSRRPRYLLFWRQE